LIWKIVRSAYSKIGQFHSLSVKEKKVRLLHPLSGALSRTVGALIIVAVVIAAATTVVFLSFTGFGFFGTSNVQGSTGVIIPLFTNDSSQRSAEINEVIQLQVSHPTVPMLLVFDDNGGPGVSYNATLASQMKAMQSAGITVLGYDPTWWGTREVSEVEGTMQTFKQWYSVNGIYLDQMPNWNYNGPNDSAYYTGPGGEYIPGYFATLSQYGRSLGLTKIVANAGSDVPTDFIGSVSTIGIFENPYLPSLSPNASWNSLVGLNGWHTKYNKSNFMFFSYNISSVNTQYILAAAKYVGYMYITNGSSQADNRYSTLSPFLGQIVSVLASSGG
jgi:hypothetical protein